MYLLDNNILIYAFQPGMEHHETARKWLNRKLQSGIGIRLTQTAEVGFLRVATHPRIFSPPAKMEEAGDFLRALSSYPNVEICNWNSTTRERWLSLGENMQLSGNDCNDALLAAIALEKQLTLATFDKGFKRFEKLSLETPLN